MADTIEVPVGSADAALEEGWFSPLDTALIGVVAALVIWYYFKTKADDDKSSIPNNIQIRWVGS